MCLILFAVDAHADYRIVLAANRDEFLSRPTRPLFQWKDEDIVAGRDLVGGGTWLGVSSSGRVAAVTNVREPGRHRLDAASRGDIVVGALTAEEQPKSYLQSLESDAYNGFNAVAWDGSEAWYLSNRAGSEVDRIPPGVHGLSNAALDTPWPKVVAGKAALEAALPELAADRPDFRPLLDMLRSAEAAPDEDLPETGVGLDVERRLSSPFIQMDGYGTRSSSVLLVRRDGLCTFSERTWLGTPNRGESRTLTFRLDL